MRLSDLLQTIQPVRIIYSVYPNLVYSHVNVVSGLWFVLSLSGYRLLWTCSSPVLRRLALLSLLVLNDLKVPVQKQFSGQKKKEQWGHTQAAPSAVILQDQEPASGTVPSVVGMGAKDAVYLLESKGLKVRLNGFHGRNHIGGTVYGTAYVKRRSLA